MIDILFQIAVGIFMSIGILAGLLVLGGLLLFGALAWDFIIRKKYERFKG